MPVPPMRRYGSTPRAARRPKTMTGWPVNGSAKRRTDIMAKNGTKAPPPRARRTRPQSAPSFDVRPEGLAERAGETPVPKLEVALLGVTVFRQPGVAASAPPGRSRWARGLDWAVMPLQVTILLGM